MNRIKEIRTEAKMSQKEFAQIFGIAQNTLSQYENEKRDPDTSLLIQISDYFHVTVDYLLGNSDSKSPVNNSPTDDDIKFALFGGEKGISDEAYEDVKRFAAFIKEKYKKD